MPMNTSEHITAGHAVTGRISQSPSALLHEEVLAPQFAYELEHLLPFYLQIERVQLSEYQRLELIAPRAATSISVLLGQITPTTLTADPSANFSDICFAIEQFVEQRLEQPCPAWHVDRSRNDVQACAQLMFGRSRLIDVVGALLRLGTTVIQTARRYTDMPMPGYTHYQAAQVISPAFYLSALGEHLIGTARRLLRTYDDLNVCPLGAGAMAGQELPWDRAWMAELLGFDRPQRHTLVAVAGREWLLALGTDLALFGSGISRFVTDLIHWGSQSYGFIDLPDELSGISSAMPQKKNFPVLERIRGKSGHLAALANDLLLSQRNTAFCNLVEVSKEGGAALLPLFEHTATIVRLLDAVLARVSFQREPMAEACRREFLGGFSLANRLTLVYAIPYRAAQIIAGRYIVAAIEHSLDTQSVDLTLLAECCHQQGFVPDLSDLQLGAPLSVEHNLYARPVTGSTAPTQVVGLLDEQQAELSALAEALLVRSSCLDQAERALDEAVGERDR